MIVNSRQSWSIGDIVKIGFVSGLKVEKIVPTPGDGYPDEYLLSRMTAGGVRKWYSFVPHNGLIAL